MHRHVIAVLLALACAACERPTAEPSPPRVEPTTPHAPAAGDTVVRAHRVTDAIHMLEGRGGNIGVFVGDDGVLLIDDQFADLAPQIREAVAALSPRPITYVLNTHHHGDHTGGNAAFGASATLIAHDNVRKRLLADEQPAAALPVLTFDARMTVHFGGETIRAVHYAGGHTDGDAVIFFERANVVHMGDHFFNGKFPYVDLGAGGSPQRMLDNVRAVLERIDDDTRVIPGHGPLAGKKELAVFADMLADSIATVKKAIDAGDSLAKIQARGLPRWKSWDGGFVNQDRWLATLHQSLTGS